MSNHITSSSSPHSQHPPQLLGRRERKRELCPVSAPSLPSVLVPCLVVPAVPSPLRTRWPPVRMSAPGSSGRTQASETCWVGALLPHVPSLPGNPNQPLQSQEEVCPTPDFNEGLMHPARLRVLSLSTQTEGVWVARPGHLNRGI